MKVSDMSWIVGDAIKATLLVAQCYWLVYWLSPDTIERNLNQPLDIFGDEATCSNKLVKIFVAEYDRPGKSCVYNAVDSSRNLKLRLWIELTYGAIE